MKKINKSISLLGLSKDTNTKLNYTGKNFRKKDIISIDSECLGWSGAQNTITKAFKLAWLSYVPSKIDHEGNQFTREDFIALIKSKLEEWKFSVYIKQWSKAWETFDNRYNILELADINISN